jgi:hypothetical protein
MATIGANVLTLADWAKRLDPDGKVPSIVEMLSQTNEILTDMMWAEGNLPTGHRTTVRTGLPNAAWRLLNNGVQPSKSTTAQIDEACGILEAWSEVDKDLAMLNGNTPAFRLSEAQAFIEAMNQEMADTIFYGNSSTAPEEFTGLAARYSSLSAANGKNILSATASPSGSDNMSVWLICWGGQTVHGIFPKGSQAGLVHNDHGEVTVETTAGMAGTRLRAYQDQWQWKCGIALRDWRYAVRIANIDESQLDTAGTAVPLINNMVKAIHRIPTPGMGRCAFYANRTVKEFLDLQALSKSNVYLNVGEEEGKPKTMLRGIPVRTCDALRCNEATVS